MINAYKWNYWSWDSNTSPKFLDINIFSIFSLLKLQYFAYPVLSLHIAYLFFSPWSPYFHNWPPVWKNNIASNQITKRDSDCMWKWKSPNCKICVNVKIRWARKKGIQYLIKLLTVKLNQCGNQLLKTLSAWYVAVSTLQIFNNPKASMFCLCYNYHQVSISLSRLSVFIF